MHVTIPKVRALFSSFQIDASIGIHQEGDALDDMLDHFALNHVLADVCAPNPLGASCIGFEPSEEDVTHVAGQLCCLSLSRATSCGR